MKVRFQADADLNQIIVKASRVLVTHDRRTMPKYFAARLATTSSSGVIVVPQ
ncbi:MAG: hypothetical protein AAF716_18125 [Cyanobacteria bacterium P01_D01_bin.1]